MTAADILAAAEDAQARLAARERELMDGIKAIRQAAFFANRDPTPDEEARRTQLETELTAVRAATQEVLFEALRDVDASATIAEMRARIDAANVDLRATKARLDRAAEVTKTVADVAAALVKLAGMLGALAI